MIRQIKPSGKEPKATTVIVIATSVVAIVGLVVAFGYRGTFRVYTPSGTIDGVIERDRADAAN